MDEAELASMFNDKTKAIIYNNPNNPLGKVYKREEMEVIANLCKKHNVVCISDDVYEHMVRSDAKFKMEPQNLSCFFRSLREVR